MAADRRESGVREGRRREVELLVTALAKKKPKAIERPKLEMQLKGSLVFIISIM
jgi:hypothetical protein